MPVDGGVRRQGVQNLSSLRARPRIEFEIELVCDRDEDRGRQCSRDDIDGVVVSAVNRGEAEQDDEHEVGPADRTQVTKGEVKRADGHGDVAAGEGGPGRLEHVVNPGHDFEEHPGFDSRRECGSQRGLAGGSP